MKEGQMPFSFPFKMLTAWRMDGVPTFYLFERLGIRSQKLMPALYVCMYSVAALVLIQCMLAARDPGIAEAEGQAIIRL